MLVTGEMARFEGHVARIMGDGVLAYFGWPKAHEDGAERAVRAGLAVRRGRRKLRTPQWRAATGRVGIATGLVVVGDLVGEGPAQEEVVVGETPNLAARLQQLAGPGTGGGRPTTRRLVGEPVRSADLGVPRSRDSPIASIAGRLHEAPRRPLRGLHARVSSTTGRPRAGAGAPGRSLAAGSAGDGQVVVLSGEPGIGKSRLVLALYAGFEASMVPAYACNVPPTM